MTPTGAGTAERLSELLARLRDTRAEIERVVGAHVDAVVDPSDGSTTYMDAALREVLAQGAAQERDATFRAAVIDAIPANVAVLDRAGVVIAVNESWRRFALANGASSDAFVGANYLDVSAAATGSEAAFGQGVAQRLRALLAGESNRVVLEYPCHAPDQQRWFRMIATRPTEGSDIGAVVTHVDVTDVVRSERTLRDGERRMAAILDALDEGVCAVGVDGRVALLNPAARRLLGLGEGQAIGAPIGAVIRRFGADRDRVEQRDLLASTLREGRGIRVTDEYFERADGVRFPAEYDVAPLRDTTGAVVGAVVTFADVGARRAIEVSLTAAKRLEALGQLTGGVAHDFNNLLTVIGGNAELLADTLPDGPLRRSAELIRIAAERGAAITQHLLAFGRRQALAPRHVDLRAVAGEIQDLLQHAAGGSVQVDVHVSDDVWPVRVDPARFDVALLNLVTNARDALPGGGTVRVDVRNATLDAAHVEAATQVGTGVVADVVAITVTDDGVGIREADLPRVFEPFFTTKAQTKGTGLGLSTVHGFAHQSGGAIDIRSVFGEGTTVSLYLPRHDGSNVDADASPTMQAAALGATLGATVLVVDDDPMVRAYASELLRRLGCVSVEAAGPSVALRILSERDDVDVVFSDIAMADAMDGYALAHAVRASWPWIAVVLTSAYDAQRAVHGRDGEPWPLLPKPYGQHALEEAIAGALPTASSRSVGGRLR